MHRAPWILVTLLSVVGRGFAQDAKVGKLPHVAFDSKTHEVRVECEMMAVNAPLEFFCCVKGTNDYEAMIRSEVKPSDLHFALLAVGLKPGEPVHYSEATKKWFPPHGPPLHISMEYEKDGKTVVVPASRWMRDAKTKKEAPPFTWVFVGSRTMPDGKYAADVTGYLVTVVNFELAVVDIPELASSSNETLEWERNPDVTPAAGAKVWMVLQPAGDKNGAAPAPAPNAQTAAGVVAKTQPAAPDNVDSQIGSVQQRVKEDREQWQKLVAKHRAAMREAAESHYRLMEDLHRQQQKLIDAADKVQRTMDELEKEYQDLTTPRPDTQPAP